MCTCAHVRVMLHRGSDNRRHRTDAHMSTRPPRPPVMALVKERRERIGMSQRTAAALAEVSPTRWRQLEDGGREIRGTWIPEDAPEMTLARMAAAVRLSPEDVKPHSPRAAQMLADLIAERDVDGRRDADDASRMVDALGGRDLTPRQRAALEAEVADALRRLRGE